MWNVSTAFQWVTTRLQQHTQSFPYENHCECYKKLVSRSRPVLFTLKHYLFLYIHSPVLLQNKKVLCRPSQIVCTVTTMNVTCTQATLCIHKNLWICQFVRQFFFSLPCAWMILSCITSCEGHELWKLTTVHCCYQPVTIENYFSPAHTDHYDLRL